MMKPLKYLSLFLMSYLLTSCNKFLDIVPDNVATIDNAFAMRSTAERYLYTCYSYMPLHGDFMSNPAHAGGDELLHPFPALGNNNNWIFAQLARGNQNVVHPVCNYWDGDVNDPQNAAGSRYDGVTSLYQGIRVCNIFLERIANVPDLKEPELKQWIAEVKFLKAYYHFWLFRMYGPIPLIKHNLPVSAGVEEVQLKRAPVDSCVNYIAQLLNEAIPDLPDRITNNVKELGRITKPIAQSVKAILFVTAASPLFNGNPDYAGFHDKEGTSLFPATYDPKKWDSAANACREAIELCERLGKKLYYFNSSELSGLNSFELSDTTKTEMNIRNAMCRAWNEEIIWGDPNSLSRPTYNYGQGACMAILNSSLVYTGRRMWAVPLKIAEMFYTNHGLPINEDKTWNYGSRYDLKTAAAADRYDIEQGYTTSALNFDREPRFYADLGFDGGIWFGQGRYDDKDSYYVQAKLGQLAGGDKGEYYSMTGYWPKKVVHFQSTSASGNRFVEKSYPWPVIRLAELYLLYSESLNEINGPTSEALKWVDLVRQRAGIPSVEDAWSMYAKQPDKYKTKDGFRELIHQESLIELAFETQRFWYLRRWKEGPRIVNVNLQGWDITQSDAEDYYKVKNVFHQTFNLKDYFWPISEHDLEVNQKLVQNPGW